MNTIVLFLAEHGLVLLVGATSLLAVGCLGTAFQRPPVQQQRAGELAVLGILVWFVSAVVPLPRLTKLAVLDGPTTGPSAYSDADATAIAFSQPPRESMLRDGLIPTASRGNSPRTETATHPAASHAGDVPPPSTVAGITSRVDVPPNAVSGFVPKAHETVALSRPSQTRPSLDLRRIFAVAYLLGLAGCLGWLVLGRLLLSADHLDRIHAPKLAERLYGEVTLPCKRRPRLLVSRHSARPIAFGLSWPVIVLPECICSEEHAIALRCVLRHELTHVARRDALGQLLFNLAFPLFYFHPLYWWLRSRVHLAAELIADDQAVDGEAKPCYVRALIDLARRRELRLACLSSQGLFGSPSQFFRRMQMLLATKTRLDARCSRRWRWLYSAACVVAVGLAASVLGVPPAQAQNGPNDEEVTRAKQQAETLRKENDGLRSELAALKSELAALKAASVPPKPDLIAQQNVRDKLTSRLPETLTAKISAIPGVREVNTGLVDLVSLEGAGPVGVLVQGWPADGSWLKKLDLVQGRLLTARDTDGVIVGRSLAAKLNKKISDELTLFEDAPTYRIVGIYRGKSVSPGDSAILLLGSLQKRMKAEGLVSGFTVLLEDPDMPKEVERIKNEIEKLGKNVDIVVTRQMYR